MSQGMEDAVTDAVTEGSAEDAAADEELLKEALMNGIDLREYAKNVESELKAVESASIDDYLREDENLKNLHKDIRSCDQILEQMQHMLGGFQQVRHPFILCATRGGGRAIFTIVLMIFLCT